MKLKSILANLMIGLLSQTAIGQNLITNPTLESCTSGGNDINSVCDGWDVVDGSPNTFSSGCHRGFHIWANCLDANNRKGNEVLRGSFASSLQAGQTYSLCMEYRLNNAPGYNSSLDNVYLEFSQTTNYQLPSNDCNEDQGVVTPDPVIINSQTVSKVWHGQGLTNTTEWIDVCITFEATAPSQYFTFYLVPTTQVAQGILVRYLSLQEGEHSSGYTEEPIAVDFDYTPTLCATTFESNIESSCTVTSHTWDFDDEGATSSELNPIYAYAREGQYDVKLSVTLDCPCAGTITRTKNKEVTVAPPEDLFKDTTIAVQTQRIDSVLSATASTFSDAWPIDHPSEALTDKHSYLNGSQGVWRTKERFVYDVPRKASTDVNPAQDGTFTLETFNWQRANLRAIPHWLPTNEVTKYSPYGYELENRDVLNRHSAALYSYGGQLPQAIGTNMRHDEIAYTGFEYLDNKRDGNWQLGTDPSPAYQRYEVETGRKRIVLVKASLETLDGVDAVDVIAKRVFRPARFVAQNPIVCRYSYEDNPDWSVLVLERPVVDNIWWGHIMVRGTQSPGIATTLDNTWAHSGKKSLKITNNLTLPQELLVLDSGKQYLVSTWVSVKNLALTEPKLADGIGLRLVGTRADNTVTLDKTFAPSGPIVEGWQRLQGSFIYPGEGAKLSLTFKKGNAATAWFDDLRMHPVEGNLQAYVYDPATFRLQATLDENGYATLYYYDQEGNLYLTKKETERGIQTIQESIDYQADTN